MCNLKDVGTTLTYHESKKYIDGIKKDGIIQFLHLYKKFKDLEGTGRLWGDELEYHIVNVDPETGKVRIKLTASEIIQRIQSDAFEVQPEFGKWMIEAVPKKPYDIVCDPERVFGNISLRRTEIQRNLDQNDYILPIPVFFLLGVGDYYSPTEKRETEHERLVINDSNMAAACEEEEKSIATQKEDSHKKDLILKPMEKADKNEFSRSKFVDDEIMSAFPRYFTYVRNFRLRRGSPMSVKIPIFRDVNTSFEMTEDEPFPGYIFMDAALFGMGNGCLQQTFSTKGLPNARYLTDQLAVIAPLMVSILYYIG